MALIRAFQHMKVLRWILILALVDLVATVTWVATGVTTEANPFMAEMYEISPVVFACVKLFLSFFFVVMIEKFASYKVSRFGLKLIALVYSFIAGGHVGILLLLAWSFIWSL